MTVIGANLLFILAVFFKSCIPFCLSRLPRGTKGHNRGEHPLQNRKDDGWTGGKKGADPSLENIAIKNKSREDRPLSPIHWSHQKRKSTQKKGEDERKGH